MTIQVITGCVAKDIVVDGVSIDDMSESQVEKIQKRVIEKILKENPTYTKTGKYFHLPSLLFMLAPESWDNESEPCEMCGETVSWRIYNI